ncbi:hypothetical protein ACFLSY_11165 [Bacteroidota bacterium]
MSNPNEKKLKELASFVDAIMISMRQSITVSHKEGFMKYASFKEFMRKYNQIAKEARKIVDLIPVLVSYNLDKVKGSFDTLPSRQKQYFDSVYTNFSILKCAIENKLDLRYDEIINMGYFIQSNLRKVIFSKPEKEIEVQNGIEQLFIGKGLNKGIDYGRETGRVKVSIKEVVPDFILYKLNLAIEVKLSKNKTKSKIIVDEINSDIQSYGKVYSNILFIIYDLESIRDEEEFINDLDNKENIKVIIVKH